MVISTTCREKEKQNFLTSKMVELTSLAIAG
jgi:hypothetical protein